ncbi:hypothetical protein RDn1_080 [Candidatus Termititenax dinenymphae]|uniref:Uncharacterized protein n=1 Tax=Candidatus Termititenax dinenymphae TaxID=2218523 RepID=A0A388TKK8_9BACT|nr:hypothetical protein RDn1_080 [Candidatus Termititenax dinenymphae]
MHVIDMISWQEADKYLDCENQENLDDFLKCVKEYILKNNIRIGGFEHQRNGVPLIEYNGQKYAFLIGLRAWGALMAEALEPENKDEYAYCKWAWNNPDVSQS